MDALWEQYRSVSPYNYAENNPVVLKDPSGYGPILKVIKNIVKSPIVKKIAPKAAKKVDKWESQAERWANKNFDKAVRWTKDAAKNIVETVKGWFGKDVTKEVLKPLGRGSTGRTEAANLIEEMAMENILRDPKLGTVVMTGMKDSRWLGWSKMQYIVTSSNGVKTVIHYVAQWENGVLKAVDDFKFK